ncbi:hypothetical protein [Pectobacterium versatile]|uniref:phage tail fiber protein n=2 Tax=Pectobacterium versatile TaxID=2488639 RepID=UPI0032096FD1
MSGGTLTGELLLSTTNALRLIYGDYGVIMRNDGNRFYLLLTNKGDKAGNYNTLRPFDINLATGDMTVGHDLNVTGLLNEKGQRVYSPNNKPTAADVGSYTKAETDTRVAAATTAANNAATSAANANTNANGRVPSARKVNGKELTSDIALSAGDVGAYTKAETDTRVATATTAANNAATAATSANTNANGRVPSARKVNGKELTADIALSAGDVGAYTKAETDTRVETATTAANNAATAASSANTNANGRVPSGRKVNGKALTADIALTATDVGALPTNGIAVAATKLATPRKINGVAFDGSMDITLTPANLGLGEFNLIPVALLQFSSHLIQRSNFKAISNDTLEVSFEIKSHGRFVEIDKTRLFILDDNSTIIPGKGTSRFNPVGKFIVTSIAFSVGNNNLATVRIYYQNHGLDIGSSKVFRVAGFVYREIGCSWMGHVSTSGTSYNSYYMTLNKPVSVKNAPIVSSAYSSHYDFDDSLDSVTIGADNQPTSISATMLGKDIVSFSIADTDIVSPRDTDMATIIVYDLK